MPSLLITQGPLAGRRLEVEGELVLGRAGTDVTIDDPLISRRHAVVRVAGDALEISDLDSLNGTWVNGERITASRRLAPGDVVALGGTTVAVESDSAVARGTLRAPLPAVEPPSRDAWAPPPTAGRAPDEVEDELRTVTALFADVVGSTSFGERLGAHESKALIGGCVTRMSRVVERYGGSVQAYMGDGIAAFFGVPVAHEDDPERAGRAALAVLEAVREYAREVESTWGIQDFNARLGINTGEAAVGLVGASEPQAVAVGDATNVAARLQSSAEPGTIAVGEATARALVHRFALEPLGDLAVRGRERPVAAWRLVAAQPTTRTLPATPLVDREDEVARLRAVLHELDAGRGQIVVLLGEAGVGKTRLLAELRSLAADRATWLEGHCLSYGTELLYDPFIRILRSWIGAEESEPESSVEVKLRGKLGLVPAFAEADVLPYLARLLALSAGPEADERLRALPHEELGAGIRRACKLWLNCLADRGPVVVALEDLQWLDPATAQLADGLLELTEQVPLLLVCTLRADPASHGWRLRGRIHQELAQRSTELHLQPLSEEGSRRLLASLPRSRELDESSLDLVVASAEGNPLYLEELLTAFADGTASKRGQTWAPTATSHRVLTPTLEGIMLSRLDRLPRGARRLAQTAAVIGRRFPLGVLEHLAPPAELTEELATLLRADVIHEARRYPETEYTFRHGLLRQAVLATLPPPRRRELYGAVAAAFEAHFEGSPEDHAELLAHYFVRGGQHARALDCLRRAAARAAELDARPHAAELWERAAKVAARLGDGDEEARLRALSAETLAGDAPAA